MNFTRPTKTLWPIGVSAFVGAKKYGHQLYAINIDVDVSSRLDIPGYLALALHNAQVDTQSRRVL